MSEGFQAEHARVPVASVRRISKRPAFGRRPCAKLTSTTGADRFLPGTELIVKHRLYWHHGIYVGEGCVIQYAGWFHSAQGLIEEVSLHEFSKRGAVCIGAQPRDLTHAQEIVRRARSRLGERGYDLLRNNCEHFCAWCHDGHSRSRQVEALSRAEYLFYQYLQGLRSSLGRPTPLPSARVAMA